MSSRSLQITEAVLALCTTPALTGIGSAGVQDDPDYAFELRDLPFVSVHQGDEIAPERNLISAHDHSMILTLRITAKKGGVPGKSALASCDPILLAVHARLMADLTIGGLALDVRQGAIRRQRDLLEMPVAITEVDYTIDYRTTTTSLE